MSEAVVSSHSSEVGNFLDSLFEGQEGYIYTPTKNPATGHWQTYFWPWPQQRDSAITHILDATKSKDCYVAPSIFKAPSDKKKAWKGSNYVWCEFDGNAPDNTPSGIPTPTIRVQSSTKGHEHWYWRLEEFETDYRVIEGLAKAITYTLDADKSGWDSSQVLRPPGTLHQDSKRRVRLLKQDSRPVGIGDFKGLVESPESVVLDTNFDDVPDSATVVSKYRWDKEAWELFQKKEQPTGSRSSAMTRLGFHCVEMGMTNEECYSILYNADERWGKFKNRPPADRAKRLIGIITHCRSKKALEAELNLSEAEHFVSWGDFRTRDIKVDWLYENLLLEKGLCIISSAPGVGKSTLSIRFACNLILEKRFLLWPYHSKIAHRIGFLSLEMGASELSKFQTDMMPSFEDEELEKIDKRFFFLDRGYSMNLWARENQQVITDEIDRLELTFLIIDSLKAAGGLDEKKAEQFFEWVNKDLRKDRGMTVWVIHHNRKPPTEGQKKPQGLQDLYGDTFIGAHATTVFTLWPVGKNLIEFIPMKMRLSEMPDTFKFRRTEHLDFELALDAPVAEEGTASDKRSKSLFG